MAGNPHTFGFPLPGAAPYLRPPGPCPAPQPRITAGDPAGATDRRGGVRTGCWQVRTPSRLAAASHNRRLSGSGVAKGPLSWSLHLP